MLLFSCQFQPVESEEDNGDKPIDFGSWSSNELVWPDWAVAEEPEVTEDNIDTVINLYRTAITSYEEHQNTVKQLRYLLENYPEYSIAVFTKLLAGMFLNNLREDHAAYKLVTEVNESDEEKIDYRGDDIYYKEMILPVLLGVFSRNGFITEMEKVISDIDAFVASDDDHNKPGTFVLNIAKAYFLTNNNDKALERLALISDESIYSYAQKMASTTVGAVSLAFRMGKPDKVNEYSQWMIDLGFDSQKYIPDLKNTYSGLSFAIFFKL